MLQPPTVQIIFKQPLKKRVGPSVRATESFDLFAP